MGNPQDIAQSLNNLGNVYESLGQLEEALDYHHRALTLQEKLGNPQDIATSLNSLGNVDYILGQLEEALDYYNRVLTLRENGGNPQEIAESLGNLGLVYESLGQHEKALDYHNRALTLFEKLGNPYDIAKSLNNLGTVYDNLGQLEKALDYYNRALTLREKVGNPQEVAYSLNSLGLFNQALHRFDKAEQAFSQARQQFEKAQDQVTDPTQIGAFQQTLIRFYAHYAFLRLQCHLPWEALTLADNGRAQGLARQSAQSRTDLSHLFAPQDATHWQTANQEDTTAHSLLLAAQRRFDQTAHQTDLQEKTAAQTQLTDAQAHAEQAQRNLQQLRSDLYRRYPRFRQLKGADPLDVKQLKSLTAQHPDTLFLHYDLVNDSTTLLFALSQREGLHTFVLPQGDKQLAALTRQWRTQLTAPLKLDDPKVSIADKGALKAQLQQEPHTASRLYNTLIRPLDTAGLLRAGRYKHLVLVADGPLLDIPFAALLDPQGHRLIERFSLSMSISLGFLAWPTQPRSAHGSLFFAADPAGPNGEHLVNRGGVLHLMGGGFVSLPVARRGAEQVAQLFSGAQGLTGSRAIKSAVEQQMAGYGLLLFATHGWLDANNGLRSWLLLAPEAGKNEMEGLFYAQELLGLKLSARLAVLMACESGLGQQRGGEGLEGLVWGFWAAGCPSVVGSEWEVDEEATSRLMVAFHRGLRSGQRKDEALRAAMLGVKKEPQWRFPYFWLSFAVYGDTAPLPASLTGGKALRANGGGKPVP